MTPIKYFQAEKIYCVFGALFAAFSLLTAIYLLMKVRQPFYNGVSYPFLLLGLFFLIICASVALRAPADLKRVTTYQQENKTMINELEIPRMEKVMNSFRMVIRAESVFLLASLITLLIASSSVWKGVAVGTLAQSLFFLVFDLLAQARGKEYLAFLKSL